jgi:hypothetical protein
VAFVSLTEQVDTSTPGAAATPAECLTATGVVIPTTAAVAGGSPAPRAGWMR